MALVYAARMVQTGRSGRRPPTPVRRRRGRVLRRVVLGLVVVVVVLAGVMAWQAWTALTSARAANTAISDFRARLLDRDVAGAEDALARAQEETASARSSLGGPLWRAAAALPAVGDDVDAARRLSVTADDVTQGAMPAVMTALSFVDPRDIGLRGGRVELAPVRRASGQLTRASELLEAADDDADAIDTDGLVDPLRTRVTETQRLLGSTSVLADRVAIAARLLPGMLGEERPRNYVVIAQNNAEQRSLGGIGGAFVLLRAADGRLSVERQASAADIGSFEEPVLPLTRAETALYGEVLGRFPQNVTDTPDFPRAAELLTEMWQRRIGGKIDGVVAVDPFALQLLLRAVGPVETDAGRLTGRNAAQRLLVDVYDDVEDTDQQDAVFAQAAEAVFNRVRGSEGDPRALTRALAEGVDQGRVMVWSVRPREQAVLRTTALGRTLRDITPASPRVGVYLHDRVGSKINAYQRVRATVEPDRCGTTTGARVRVRIASTVPLDRDLPTYVTGDGSQAAPGDMLTQVVVYAAPGWTITGVDSSDGSRDLVTFRHDGLWAGTRDVRIAPGRSATLTVSMKGVPLSADLGIRYTPGTKPANFLSEGSGCS